MSANGNGKYHVIEYTRLVDLFLPLFWPNMWMMLVRTLIITVLPLHVLEMGLSYETVSFLAAMNGIGGVSGNIPGGIFNAKYGPRKAQMLEGVIYAVAAALISLPLEPHNWLVVASFSLLLMGGSETMGQLSRGTVLGATVSTQFRGRVGATMGGAYRTGATVGPFIGGMVAHVAGVTTVFMVQIVCALLHVVMAMLFVPNISAAQDINAQPAERADVPQVVQGAKEDEMSVLDVLRKHWKMLFKCSFFVCMVLCFRKAREMVFAMEGHARGMSQASVGSIASLSYLVDSMFFPIAGLLMDNVGRTWTASITLFGGFISLLILARPEITMVVFAVVAGFANACSAGLFPTIGADIAPAECRAKFLGLYRTFCRFSDFLAPLTLGILAHRASLSVAMTTTAFLSLFGVFATLCCMPETLVQNVSAKDSSLENGARPLTGLNGNGKYHPLDDESDEDNESLPSDGACAGLC